jgi:hypothetical protein
MYSSLRAKQDLTEKDEEMVDQLKGGDFHNIVDQATAMSNAQQATVEKMGKE